ncbi:MAG: hypothetical protein ACO1SX_26655 [Actinomycetota bacterium]
MSFKRIPAFIFLCGLLTGSWSVPVQAHPADEAAVFHYLWLQPQKGEVALQHGTIVGGLLTQAVWPTLDTNGDNELSVEEQETHAQSIVAGLSVRIDGKPVKWRLQAYEYPSHTEFFGTSFAAIKLLVTAPLGKVTAKGRDVEIKDESFPHFKGVFPQPVIRPDGLAVQPPVVSQDGRVTRIRLLPEGAPVAAAPPATAPAPAAESGRPRLDGLEISPSQAPNGPASIDVPGLDVNKIFPKPEAFAVTTEGGHGGETARLKDFLNRPLSPGLLAAALLAALLAGMAHAFSPGHGKSMVAAYLVGSKGTVRDAIVLGVVVTITHTLGVYLLGFLTLWLTTSFQVERVGLWLEVVSGALVLAMGFWLFQRGLLAYHGVKPLPGHSHGPGGHSHGHAHHGHAHDHAHSHVAAGGASATAKRSSAEVIRRPPSDSPLDDPAPADEAPVTVKPGRWGIIGLGIAGGMVPCFDALAILIAAVNLASGRPPQEKAQYIGAGLGLIGAFSLGMALVLVAIGILMVKAKDLMARFTGESRFMRGLPAASGALLFFLGAWLTLQALVHAGVLRVG